MVEQRQTDADHDDESRGHDALPVGPHKGVLAGAHSGTGGDDIEDVAQKAKGQKAKHPKIEFFLFFAAHDHIDLAGLIAVELIVQLYG